MLTRQADYSLASIANETIEASKGNANAFMEAATVEIDGAIESATRSLAIACFGDGSGAIGQVLATTSSVATFTLKQIDDVTNFEVGMQLKLNATKTGSSGTLSTAVTVDGINRDTGVITLSASASLTADHFIYQEGDYDAKIKGLNALHPSLLVCKNLHLHL